MRIPQKPRMTLGMAASISTSGPMTALTRRGARRLRNRPIDMPIGSARAKARSELMALPYSRVAAPKTPKFAFQAERPMKPSPKADMAELAPFIT